MMIIMKNTKPTLLTVNKNPLSALLSILLITVFVTIITSGYSSSACAAAVTEASASTTQTVREKVVVIKAGTVITVSGDEISPGEIVIIDGKIELVGRNLEYPKPATVINVPYETVMPGMIHAHTRHGLPSFNKSGVNGNARADDFIKLNDIDFEDFLKAGFTAVCYNAPGTGIPGVATVYRTAGEDENTRQVIETSYLSITMDNPSRDKRTLRGAFTKAQAEIDKVAKARKDWEEKQAKAAEEKKKAEAGGGNGEPDKKAGEGSGNGGDKPAPNPKADDGENKDKPQEGAGTDKPQEPAEFVPPAIDPAHQIIVDWLQGKLELPPLIELRGASDLIHLNDVLDDKKDYAKLDYRYYLTSSADYNYVIDQLVKSQKLILADARMHVLPQTNTQFNVIGELFASGCDLALVPAYDDANSLKGYRGSLQELVRYGVKREEILRAVTINPAKIAGIDKKLGSIEKGKDADLIFLDRDPLNPLAKVTRVMILGEIAWEPEQEDK